MTDAPAQAPPPPMTAYAPPPGYAPAPSQSPSSGVKLPAGMTLWDLIGFLIILVGAILVLVGFLLGDAAVSALTSSPPSQTTYQNDLEGFFIWTGLGVFLTILGYLCRSMLFPMMQARKRAAPAYAPAPMAAPVAAPAPAPAPAPVAPAVPACPTCGKPTTYIAQYGRYYCYADAKYV
jgi:hypothetical protein